MMGVVSSSLTFSKNMSLEHQLHDSAWFGDFERCTALLQGGAVDVNSLQDKTTPLHRAANNGHDAVCELLIQHGADVNAADERDARQPLHIAALRGHAEACKALLYYGADVNAKDALGSTPMDMATDEGHNDLCILLVNHDGTWGEWPPSLQNDK